MEDVYKDREFIRDAENVISQCRCPDLTQFVWLSKRLSDLCRDYKKSSYVFKQLVRLLKDGSFNLQIMEEFIHNRCGLDLNRWVTLDETTNENIQIPATSNRSRSQQDSLRLFLDFLEAVKAIMLEKGFDPHSSVIFEHLVNQNLVSLRIANIPLLLRYGLKLEFTDDLYNQTDLYNQVMRALHNVLSYSLDFTFMIGHPNRKRMILVLVMICTVEHLSYIHSYPNRMNNAVRTLWRSIPDPHLCKREITEVFLIGNIHLDIRELTIRLYKELVCEGEFTEMAQPRSLGHLSRCEVRNAMAANKALPYGIEELPIPMPLQSYVLLES